MKYWSTVFVDLLLCGVVFGSSELASDCISTHLLPVITTSVSVSGLVPTDLMPEATGAIPAPGSNQPPGSGGSGGSVESVDAAVHSTLIGGSGQDTGYAHPTGAENPTGAATTPLSSANPQIVSGAVNLRPSNLAKTAFVAGSIALIIQFTGLV